MSIKTQVFRAHIKASTVRIWIMDYSGNQMVQVGPIVERPVNQTADDLNSRHLSVHYLNGSVNGMSAIQIPTVLKS